MRAVRDEVERNQWFCGSPVLLKLEDHMAWTDITRPKYERATMHYQMRYQSDLTDAEWVLIKPHLSEAPRKWTLREIVERSRMFCARAVSSACCQAICHRKALSITGLRVGAMMGRGLRPIACC